MDIKSWYRKRGTGFILERAKALKDRYGFSTRKSIQRIENCMESLRSYDCFPTFAVPGMVVEKNTAVIQRIQAAGAEIAVHGYNHVDLKACHPREASRQLKRAAEVFRAKNLEVHGFRCPYLSCSDELIKELAPGLFSYSSNKAIQWPVDGSLDGLEGLLFGTIKDFYSPVSAEAALCLPWFQDGLVEIPACVPDDLQLHDGLGYGFEEISGFWVNVLHKTYLRGELFNLMFHPELASFCEAPFLAVLLEAQTLRPRVWLARLREISDWWREKSRFRAVVDNSKTGFTLEAQCSPRATLLCRGFVPHEPASRWDNDYWRLKNCRVFIEGPVIPLIGLSPEAPPWVLTTLQGMGYLLERGDRASRCGIYLDETRLKTIANPVALVAYVESVPAPLVRFWPWPSGMRSALCISGDLDALSFIDYAMRLLKN